MKRVLHRRNLIWQSVDDERMEEEDGIESPLEGGEEEHEMGWVGEAAAVAHIDEWPALMPNINQRITMQRTEKARSQGWDGMEWHSLSCQFCSIRWIHRPSCTLNSTGAGTGQQN